ESAAIAPAAPSRSLERHRPGSESTPSRCIGCRHDRGREMAEPSPDKIVIGIVGSLIGAAIGLLPGGLTGAIGSPLTVLLGAFGGISGLAFSLMCQHWSEY